MHIEQGEKTGAGFFVSGRKVDFLVRVCFKISLPILFEPFNAKLSLKLRTIFIEIVLGFFQNLFEPKTVQNLRILERKIF